MIKVNTNEQHSIIAVRNRRLMTSYLEAVRDKNLEPLKLVKNRLELEIASQGNSKNVKFLQVVLDNVKKHLEVA